MTRQTRDRVIYWIVWAGCFLPLPMLVYWFLIDDLTADPIKEGIHYLGQWALRFLVIGLALTPLRKLFGWMWVLRFRRTIGLFAFAYLALHWTTYIAVDQGFFWEEIWKDLVKRPYITFGMMGFVLLIPLAVTSTNAMIRKLGKNWKTLHKLVYIIVPLGILHYDLLVKKDATWPHFYAIVTAILLGYRVYDWARSALRRRNTPAAPRAVRSAG